MKLLGSFLNAKRKTHRTLLLLSRTGKSREESDVSVLALWVSTLHSDMHVVRTAPKEYSSSAD